MIGELYEFALSMFILGGSGYMLASHTAPELASGVVLLVVGYWFNKKSAESAVNQLLTQPPVMAIIDKTTTATANTAPIVNVDPIVPINYSPASGGPVIVPGGEQVG